jgi:hypothetical protein
MTVEITMPRSSVVSIATLSVLTAGLGFAAYAFGRSSFGPLFVAAVAAPDMIFVLLLRDLRVRGAAVPKMVLAFVGLAISLCCASVGAVVGLSVYGA